MNESNVFTKHAVFGVLIPYEKLSLSSSCPNMMFNVTFFLNHVIKYENRKLPSFKLTRGKNFISGYFVFYEKLHDIHLC